jgi:2-oxoglutarate dehydrogenase E1 component
MQSGLDVCTADDGRVGWRAMEETTQDPGAANLDFVEQLYAEYVRDRTAVPEPWRRYFEQRGDGAGHFPVGPSFPPGTIFRPPVDGSADALQERVNTFVHAYRARGHRMARVNPLGPPPASIDGLDPTAFGITGADMGRPVSFAGTRMPCRDVIQRVRDTYCRSIGVEFFHIEDEASREWLQTRMEASENRMPLSRAEQIRMLTRLIDAEVFEQFVRQRFTGARTFSLEGSDSLIPLLDLAIERASGQGVREIVLGMAHRGRLNVLVNVMGKRLEDVFRELAGREVPADTGRGDVRYHLGNSHDWITTGGQAVHLSLCFNPSHVEFVNPIVLGRVRAKQDRSGDADRVRGLALLIHGDAAFAGEGIVQETLNLSRLPGYFVGGTLHVVVNNQIGYTTSPGEGRSTIYCTDVAKMIPAPIFHVNGDDLEAVAAVVTLGLDYRAAFRSDVVVDLIGYRRRGHNESDEPAFTQPVLYQTIARQKTAAALYLEQLQRDGAITSEDAQEIVARAHGRLERGLATSQQETPKMSSVWNGWAGGPRSNAVDVDTAVDRETLVRLLEAQTRLPAGFHPHRKVQRAIAHRLAMSRGEQPLDWPAAESLAFATLAVSGTRIRLSGQDSERGTFSQRHAVLHDEQNGREYVPLQHLADGQAPVDVYNSPLSELGVLGYEYGYSLDYPDGLVLWEAQFGDFTNAAQVIVDQFIASAETKWRRLSGLVLLLPHALEGQGPEHSSARLERFLALAAEDNMQVVYPTTPAQYFHVLRRQALRRWRKPLIVMTPKSLLRHPQSVSSFDDLSAGRFQPVIADRESPHVLLCAGKVYFDLVAKRTELKRDDVAIVRIEQLYPFPEAARRYESAVWVQEEPLNMGAWTYIRARFDNRIDCVARCESASAAAGSPITHKREQDDLLTRAFNTWPLN